MRESQNLIQVDWRQRGPRTLDLPAPVRGSPQGLFCGMALPALLAGKLLRALPFGVLTDLIAQGANALRHDRPPERGLTGHRSTADRRHREPLVPGEAGAHTHARERPIDHAARSTPSGATSGTPGSTTRDLRTQYPGRCHARHGAWCEPPPMGRPFQGSRRHRLATNVAPFRLPRRGKGGIVVTKLSLVWGGPRPRSSTGRCKPRRGRHLRRAAPRPRPGPPGCAPPRSRSPPGFFPDFGPGVTVLHRSLLGAPQALHRSLLGPAFLTRGRASQVPHSDPE